MATNCQRFLGLPGSSFRVFANSIQPPANNRGFRKHLRILKLEGEKMEEIAICEPTPTEKRRKKGRHGLGHVYQHRANWWLDARVKGTRHRVKLGPVKLLEKREARVIAESKIKEMLMPKPEPIKGVLPFSEFAEKFVAMSVETKRGREQYAGKKPDQTPFKWACEFFGSMLLKDINTIRVEEFRSHLLTKRVGKHFLKNASVNRYISLLRASLYWGMSRGDIASNPVAELNTIMLHEPEAPTRVLEEGNEESKLISALPAWLRLIAIFALQTGARRGDILNLTWEAVRPESLEFCETKDGEKRSVELNSVAKSILKALGPINKPKAFVFAPDVPRKTLISRVRREWKAALKKSGIPKLRFHDLRHTVFSRLIEKGEDIETVRDLAGHASIKTTQRYLHSNDRRKKKAIEKLAGDFGHYVPNAAEESLEQIAANITVQ
jgi:integrase